MEGERRVGEATPTPTSEAEQKANAAEQSFETGCSAGKGFEDHTKSRLGGGGAPRGKKTDKLEF